MPPVEASHDVVVVGAGAAGLAAATVLQARGRRVVNGGGSFRVETSKVAQHLLFQELGLPAPRTLLFNRRDRALEQARSFPFPYGRKVHR